ncbi:MAG: glycosyltransferase [Nanoarchaeota archaeon]
MQNISFIIPNYNAESIIGNAIESIQKQKYKGKIEIVVIDDKSTDNSLNIISKYKVKLIKNEKNLGLAKSLNEAIKAAKYDLIAIIWCDCILENDSWLNKMIKIYNSNENVAAICSKLIIPKEYWNKFSFYDKIVLTKDYEVSLKNKRRKGRPSLFNKKLLLRIGLYDDKAFRISGEDTDMRCKLEDMGYKFITAPVNILHLHGFYNLSFKKQLFNKALPLAEASGVNFRRHGLKSFASKYWNPITSTILYFSLLTPHINLISLVLILFLAIVYTIKVLKYSIDIRIIFVPTFKILKDMITIFGFWKGFITGKQEF